MNINQDYLIAGAVQGVQYGQNERVDELNDRIAERHFPDMALEPNYSCRPVPTKYSQFPIVNRRTPVREPLNQYAQHNLYNNFNPTGSHSNAKGFQQNVDVETVLRNQTFALQHGADQGVYIPTSNSDLYNVSVVSRPSDQPYTLLFERPQFANRPHPNVMSNNIGRDNFFNHTRTQLRNNLA